MGWTLRSCIIALLSKLNVPVRRHGRARLCLLAILSLWPTAAPGAPDAPQWATIQRDIGTLTVQTMGLHHYGTEWERAVIAFDHRFLKLRHGRDDAWDAWRTGGVGQLHSVALETWLTVGNRVRLDASFRHEPQMNIALPAIGVSLQLLPGSARRSAVFVSAHFPWIRSPQFETIAPNLAIEWSNELIRSRGTETRSPFIVYAGLRVDQGMRWTWFDDTGIKTQRSDLMDTVLRGALRWRYGPLSASLGFGGQQQRAFTVDTTLAWHFDVRASPQTPAPSPQESGSSPSR